jgi:hypothetical protein
MRLLLEAGLSDQSWAVDELLEYLNNAPSGHCLTPRRGIKPPLYLY